MLIFCVVNSERRRYEQCNQRDLEGENFECERLVDKDNLFRSFKLPPSSLDMTIPQYFRVFFFFSLRPPMRQGTPKYPHVENRDISVEPFLLPVLTFGPHLPSSGLSYNPTVYHCSWQETLLQLP